MSDEIEIRFMRFVQLTNSCWMWTGNRYAKGYGQIRVSGKPKRAHRISYELFVGPIPDGMIVCHECDNPPCVNPDHLYIGTQSDNIRDSVRKGRHSGLRYGEHHSQARLSNQEIEDIRAKYKTGTVSQKFLSQECKVSQMHISNIITGKRRSKG